MTDKFDYTETGQSDALIYLNSLGKTTDLHNFNDVQMDGNNAVVYANYWYAKMNPEPNNKSMNIYDIHGQETPTKAEIAQDLQEKYKDLSPEKLQEIINDAMYGGRDGTDTNN